MEQTSSFKQQATSYKKALNRLAACSLQLVAA
jgi:hypothetical protein